MKRILILALIFLTNFSWGQLSAGDIAFVQYNADSTDNFAFVCLTDIPGNEVIKFTDNEEDSLDGGEGTITWTAPNNGVSCGTIITITTTPSATVGSVTEVNDLNFSTNGDGIIAYQGNSSSPTFITALGNDGAAAGTYSGTREGNLPAGLTLGTNAQSIAEVDNAKYNGSLLTGTKNQLLQAIYDYNNWSGNNSSNQTFSGTFNVTDCSTSCTEPTTDAVFHANSPQNLTTTSATLNWTSGNGDNRIVVMKTGSAVTFVPTDGIGYAGNNVFGSGTDVGAGEYVIYNGNASTVNVSGLTPGTEYFVKIFEYSCTSGNEDYYVSGNPATDNFLVIPENPNSFTKGCVDNTSINLSWSAPAAGVFDGYLLVVREAANPHSVNSLNPSTNLGENLNYTSAATYGSTNPNSRILYKGTGTNVTVTGLTQGSLYTFKIFTYKIGSGEYKYSNGRSTSQTMGLLDVNNASAQGLDAHANISWTNPDATCFDEILVVANETAGIDFTPTGNGSGYTANSVYASPNQVVYKGAGVNVSVTNLTNGTTYYFEIFVRKGTQWSSGVEVSAVPTTATVLESGDVAIVAVNTQYKSSGGDDEICFFAFKDIAVGTAIDFTDNGYERDTAGLWGETEGTIRFKRTGGGSIAKGTVICIQGSGHTQSRFTVRVCGSDDTTNWTINSINGNYDLNLNITDQVWIMQNGSWNNPSGSHNADYTGNILFGWTATGWKTAPGYNSTSGSTIYPGQNCFNTDVAVNTNSDKVKYNGDPSVARSQLDWVKEINTSTNWLGYANNTAYNAGTNDYANSCIVFNISNTGFGSGEWTGNNNNNWFDCSNWDNMKVPDETSDVTISNTATNQSIVNHNATFAGEYGGIAKCKNLIINNGASLEIPTNQDKLEVHGDLSISANGLLDMNDGNNTTEDGHLYLYGNWTNQGNESRFDEGQSSVHLIGTTHQNVSCNNGTDTEKFYNLIINNSNGISFASSNIHAKGNLNLLASPAITATENHYILAGKNLVNNIGITIDDKASFIQTDDNDTSISGTGTFTVKKTSLNLNHYYDYVYWSTPINSANFSMGEMLPNAWRYYSFNAANQDPDAAIDPGWTWETSASTFEKGHGYAISAPQSYGGGTLSVTFIKNTDPFNNGTISPTVVVNGAGAQDENDYNLLGNPYPSAIDFNAFANENTNVQGSYYLWTNCAGLNGNLHQESGYTTYAAGTGGVAACSNAANPTASQYMASGQGFFIEANAAGSVSFKNSYRITNHNDNFVNRPTVKNRIWLDLTDSNFYYNQILLGFFDNATDEKDRLFDARAINGGFYSLIDEENFVIQGLSDLEDDNDKIIPLGFESDGTSTIKIHINRLEGELENRDVYLKDLYENVYHNLKTSDYVFTSSDGTFNDRLELWITQSTQSIDDNDANLNLVTLWQDEDVFNIKTTDNTNLENLIIYDELGRVLFNQDDINQSIFRYDAAHLPAGSLLLFKLTLENGRSVIKKTIKH